MTLTYVTNFVLKLKTMQNVEQVSVAFPARDCSMYVYVKPLPGVG